MAELIEAGGKLITEHTRIPIEKQIILFDQEFSKLRAKFKKINQDIDDLEKQLSKKNMKSYFENKISELAQTESSHHNSLRNKLNSIMAELDNPKRRG
jgi:DNA anti-recombination protein RmuC